jgi:hypothetical protein
MSLDLVTRDFPEKLVRIQENSFHLFPVGESSTSTFTTVVRSAGPRYKQWRCSMTANVLFEREDDDLRFEWEAFIHSLDGVAVAFKIYDPLRVLPKGRGAGLSRGAPFTEIPRVVSGTNYQFTNEAKLVAGSGLAQVHTDAARYADSLVMTGLVASAVVFRPGDLLEIGGNLHEVRAIAQSDASGNARVMLNNRLWKPALAGDIVRIEAPRGRFLLAGADQGRAVRSIITSSASVDMIEVPYVE